MTQKKLLKSTAFDCIFVAAVVFSAYYAGAYESLLKSFFWIIGSISIYYAIRLSIKYYGNFRETRRR